LDIPDSIGFMISSTARKLNQYLSSKFQAFDITSEQWSVLNRLAKQDGITQKELSQRTVKDPTNLTRILDQLERKAWIRREANQEDRRSFLTYVTESGRSLNEKLLPIEAQFIEKISSGLLESEMNILKKTINQINENIGRSD
jgi:DNA-binding MarR family transcriptional regulator